jgi:hypothetical protein
MLQRPRPVLWSVSEPWLKLTRFRLTARFGQAQAAINARTFAEFLKFLAENLISVLPALVWKSLRLASFLHPTVEQKN